MKVSALLLCMSFISLSAMAQPKPTLTFQVVGSAVQASTNTEVCDRGESPDAPARAIHLADGSVQLYATDQVNQLVTGPDLLHLNQDCGVVYRGEHNDDPAAFDDRSWLATPWTPDGKTIWAIVHNEFHGHLRKPLCPTGRYMDCWYNALTLAISTDGGRHFKLTGHPSVVAALPYRYDQVSRGHHGYFNPSNIVSRDGYLYMFMFATKTQMQAEGNCLLRTATIASAGSWRAWDGQSFNAHFVNPYRENDGPDDHICAPVGLDALRWPITSFVLHRPTGLYIATMQDTSRTGGVYIATSPDMLHWSKSERLLATEGVGGWMCGDAAPIAYPSLLDPQSSNQNFETIEGDSELFATEFEVNGCRRSPRRQLIRWHIHISVS